MPAPTYAAFISYKHAVLPEFVAKLEAALKQYAKPLFARPLKIFRDERHMAAGVSLQETIDAALRDSDFLILLASPPAAASAWVQDELRLWCGELQRAERLIIVLVDGDIATTADQKQIDWDRTTALPPLLAPCFDEVPLYVDFRFVRDDTGYDLTNARFKAGINRIVARLRGIDPNEMAGQEVLQHRRNLRLRNAAIATVAIAALAAAIAGRMAMLSGERARVAGEVAEERRLQAVIGAAAAAAENGESAQAEAILAATPGIPPSFRDNVRAMDYRLFEPLLVELSPDESGQEIDLLYLTSKAIVTQGWYDGLQLADLRDGHLVDRCELRFMAVAASPAQPQFLVYGDGWVHRGDGTDCASLREVPLDDARGELMSGQVGDAGRAYVGTSDGEVYAIGEQATRVYRDARGRPVRAIFLAPQRPDLLLLAGDAFVLVSPDTGAPLAETGPVADAAAAFDSPAIAGFVDALPPAARVQLAGDRIGAGRNDLVFVATLDDGRLYGGAKPSTDETTILAGRVVAVEPRCRRLEWMQDMHFRTEAFGDDCLEAPVDERLPSVVVREAGDEWIASAAFCGDDHAFVLGTGLGAVIWARNPRQGGMGLLVEHIERPFADQVRAVACRDGTSVLAGGRVSGIAAFRQRIAVTTERVPTFAEAALARPARVAVGGGEGDALVVPDDESLEMHTAAGTLRWRKRVSFQVPYRTGGTTDRIDAVAVDPARGRVWALTSMGRLVLLDQRTGMTIASIATSYITAGGAQEPGVRAMAVDPATGDLRIDFNGASDERGWRLTVVVR